MLNFDLHYVRILNSIFEVALPRTLRLGHSCDTAYSQPADGTRSPVPTAPFRVVFSCA